MFKRLAKVDNWENKLVICFASTKKNIVEIVNV